MSVMPETSQLSMGPYFASAAVTSVLYSPTAVSSSALLAKVLALGGSGDGEGCDGGGNGDGGDGLGGGGDGGDGDDGGLGGECGGDGGDGHAPRTAHAEPYALSKAETPSHAQRINTLFSSDKESVPCRVARRAINRRAVRGPEGGGGSKQSACRGGSGWRFGAGQGLSAPEG